jgi:hypothetical protein
MMRKWKKLRQFETGEKLLLGLEGSEGHRSSQHFLSMHYGEHNRSIASHGYYIKAVLFDKKLGKLRMDKIASGSRYLWQKQINPIQ